MRVRLDRRPADPAEQFAEAGIARQVAAHDERVDEEPDQALRARAEFARRSATRRRYRLAPSSGGGAPETPPAASCRASRPRFRPSARTASSVAFGKVVDRSPPRWLATGGRGRSRGQLELGHARELLRPVLELRLEDLALEPVPLPDRVIGVLDRQLGKRRRLAPAGTTGIAPRARGSGSRSTSRRRWRDAWSRGDVLSLAQSQQRCTDERSARQVERPLSFFANVVLRLARSRSSAGRLLRSCTVRAHRAGGDRPGAEPRPRRPGWSAALRVGARPRSGLARGLKCQACPRSLTAAGM